METGWMHKCQGIASLLNDCAGLCRAFVTFLLQLHGLFMTGPEAGRLLQCSNTEIGGGVVGAEGFEPPTLSV
jgi:hypothetical protein